MKNKYIILTAVYRFKGSLEEGATIEKLENNYLSLSTANNVLTKTILSKAMKSAFDVIDYKSTIDTFHGYFDDEGYFNPNERIFIKMYLDHKDKVFDLTPEYIEEYYTKGEDIKAMLDKTAPKLFYDKDTMPLEDYEEITNEYIKNIQQFVLNNYIEKTEYITAFFDFCKQFEDLLPYVKNVGFHGFNISRTIDILSSSYNLGYIEEEETLALINIVGHYAETIFENWQTFLASSLLGKLFMMTDPRIGGYNIMQSKDYINSTYNLLTSKTEPLFISGLWENSDLKPLADIILQYNEDLANNEELRNNEDEKRDKSIDLFNFVLGDEISKRGLEALFYADSYARKIKLPIEKKDVDINFWNPINSLKIEFEEDEIPFLYSKKFLFTNKAIYQLDKKMFKKVEIKKLQWDSNLVFDFKKAWISVEFYLNGIKIENVDEKNYKGKNAVPDLSKLPEEQVQEFFDNLFKEAKEMLSNIPNKLKEYENKK